jgi:hypothetical protein
LVLFGGAVAVVVARRLWSRISMATDAVLPLPLAIGPATTATTAAAAMTVGMMPVGLL